MTQINGDVAPGFERVGDAFAANFEKHNDVGAAFSLYHKGEKVVDLWGGVADPDTGRLWAEDSLQVVFSSTKGPTALCALLLVQRGELDLDAPVAKYWPEFAAAGKEDVPVRWLLSHRVGLPYIPPLTLEESLAWEPSVKALEAQTPAWTPGTKHGYHAGTYGYLVGEVIRRISGKSVGTFFSEEVAQPLGLDFWIGLPASEDHRMTKVVSIDPASPEAAEQATVGERYKLLEMAQDPDSLLNKAMSVSPPETDPNSREFYAAEIPAGNGIGDARSLARMYAALVGDGVDGLRLISDGTVRQATEEQSFGPDAVMAVQTRFGLGFLLNTPLPDGIEGYPELEGSLGQEGAFGHAGAGGSLSFADPKAEIGFSYVMNQMHMVSGGDDPRTLGLIAAVHQSLDSL